MTMTIQATVARHEHADDGQTLVFMQADRSGDKIRPYANRTDVPEPTRLVEVDQITSNTEGVVTRVEVQMWVDGQPPVVGSVIQLTGHWDAPAAPDGGTKATDEEMAQHDGEKYPEGSLADPGISERSDDGTVAPAGEAVQTGPSEASQLPGVSER